MTRRRIYIKQILGIKFILECRKIGGWGTRLNCYQKYCLWIIVKVNKNLSCQKLTANQDIPMGWCETVPTWYRFDLGPFIRLNRIF